MLAAVADTHAVIWYIFGDTRISAKAQKTIDEAARNGRYVGISTMTLAEIVYLNEKKRIASDTLSRLITLLRDPENVLTEIPIDSGIVESMIHIPRQDIPDLPDRVIAATALSLGVPIITRDRKIQAANLQSLW